MRPFRPIWRKYRQNKDQNKKRRKNRSNLRQNRARSKNENSSKSFRIKQRSTTSLQSNSKKQLNTKSILSIISKVNARKKQQNSKGKQFSMERQKIYTPSSTYTVKADPSRAFSRNDAIDVREKKHKKQLSFRKNKYESRSRNEAHNLNDINKQTIQVTKHGYTDTNRLVRDEAKNKKQQKNDQNLYAVGRKKFRRGKYQALYSSVNSNDINYQKDNPTKSESQLQITKKQSNLSINKDIDIMAQKQMSRFYRQMRSNQIRKSLEKSTEKYFKQDSSYRLPKTNNYIEIFVSTIKNPQVNRQSNASTLHTSQPQGSIYVSSIQKQKDSHLMNYDFDFKQPQSSFSGIAQMENPSEEDSFQFQEQSSFEKQRKQVEKQYFHKKSPQVDWSQQDCQIDQV